MELPLRILRDRPPHPVLVVDGHLDAPGVELSHWPGNRTPAELRHELSTGSALAFAALPASERTRLAGDAEAIANNHYDTDGACAAFAVLHPERALARRERLLAVAASGDFFQLPGREAYAVDLVIGRLADPVGSPIAAELAGLSDAERHERALRHAVELLPSLLDGDLEPWRGLWEEPLEEVRADLFDLDTCQRRRFADLDLTLWIGPHGSRAARRPSAPLSPGRHALFGSSSSDRVLVVTPEREGWTWRLVISTRSWFERPGAAPRPRPDLLALAERLNQLEGTTPDEPEAWRAHGPAHPSPELWFGGAEHPDFAEHADVLVPSTLDPVLVHAELRAACLRARDHGPAPGAASAPRAALAADPG